MTNTENKHPLDIPENLKRNGSKPVVLATADQDVGHVEANKAASEGQKLADETSEKVTARHPVSDKVLSIFKPKKPTPQVAAMPGMTPLGKSPTKAAPKKNAINKAQVKKALARAKANKAKPLPSPQRSPPRRSPVSPKLAAKLSSASS